MKIDLILDVTVLGKLMDSIRKRGAALDRDIHIAACSALARLDAHGDTGYANRLFLSLPKGARKAALASWLLAYGALNANVNPDKDTKPFVFTKDKDTDVDGGMADPWFNHAPDKPVEETFDLRKAMQALLAKAKAKQAKGVHLVGEDMLDKMAEAMAVISEPEDPADVPAGSLAPAGDAPGQ